MLENSFVFLPGVRSRTERKFWSQGVRSWSDFCASSKIKGLSSLRKLQFDDIIKTAHRELFNENLSFFVDNLPFSEQWRLWDKFKDEAVFLDIETDGYYGGVTVIGLSDGIETKSFVRGFTLDKRSFLEELGKYKLLVTFNGASFDVPVLERYFGIKIVMPHIDLRWVCQRVGLSGGLKAIERELGIRRRAEVENLSGEDAVYLWHQWRASGDRDYLDKLVWYNEEDILNLRPLANRVIPQLWKKLFS